MYFDPTTLAFLGLDLSFEAIRAWIATNGFGGGTFIVFALLFACGLGLPLPEDIPLILAGAVLLTPESPTSHWVLVALACWCGIIGGDICLYMICRRLGPNVTKVPIIGKHVTHERMERVAGLFEKYGILVVGFGRLVAGIRAAMVMTAGTIRFNFVKFVIADGIAAIFSGGLFVALGHWLGKQLTAENFERFKHYFLLGALGLIAVVIAWIVIRRKLQAPVSVAVEKKIEQKAETAGNATIPPVP